MLAASAPIGWFVCRLLSNREITTASEYRWHFIKISKLPIKTNKYILNTYIHTYIHTYILTYILTCILTHLLTYLHGSLNLQISLEISIHSLVQVCYCCTHILYLTPAMCTQNSLWSHHNPQRPTTLIE